MPNRSLYPIKFQHILIIGSIISSTNVFYNEESEPHTGISDHRTNLFSLLFIMLLIRFKAKLVRVICVVAYLSLQKNVIKCTTMQFKTAYISGRERIGWSDQFLKKKGRCVRTLINYDFERA